MAGSHDSAGGQAIPVQASSLTDTVRVLLLRSAAVSWVLVGEWWEGHGKLPIMVHGGWWAASGGQVVASDEQ